MTTWGELLGQVELWRLRIEDDGQQPCAARPGETYLELIERTLQSTEAAVCAACEQLAATHTLPPLAPAEAFHLWARLDYARELLMSLQRAPLAMPATGAVLRWLLLAAWAQGRQRLLQRVRDISARTQNAP